MHAASCASLASEVVLSPTQLLLLHLWLLMGSSLRACHCCHDGPEARRDTWRRQVRGNGEGSEATKHRAMNSGSPSRLCSEPNLISPCGMRAVRL